MNGGELIVEHLVANLVPYAVGIPGHGIITFVDALIDRADEIGTIMVRHEQSAVHLADGYFRVAGTPLAVFTSVGPGAVNTLVGVATAMADSVPVVVLTGNCQSYFIEKGAIQDISFRQPNDFANMIRPVVKRSWSVMNAHEITDVMRRAFRTALSGRPGPVHVELTMDVQSAAVERPSTSLSSNDVLGKSYPDPSSIERAASAIVDARSPVLLVGGGVSLARAERELVGLATHLGIPVITTLTSKGVIPEDHPLNAYYTGPKGSTCGVKVVKRADVLVAVGFRFSEWASGSYKDGEVFSIPPQRIVQIDVDPNEIGKNYPVEVGVLGDAQPALEMLLARVQAMTAARDYERTEAFAELQTWRTEWENLVRAQTHEDDSMSMSRALADLREELPRNGIVLTSSGHTQGLVYQEFPIYEPRTHISAAGFSTMGWSLPAAIGAKLAAPDRPVVAIVGDGDFLMTCQELACAVQYEIPIVVCVMNNSGYLSIRDLQVALFGAERTLVTESSREDGTVVETDIAALAASFGAWSRRVTDPAELRQAYRDALACGRPAVVEVMTPREYSKAGNALGQWSEFPMPENRTPLDAR